MSEIILKTGSRKTTVSRRAIRKAVQSAYALATPRFSASRSATSGKLSSGTAHRSKATLRHAS